MSYYTPKDFRVLTSFLQLRPLIQKAAMQLMSRIIMNKKDDFLICNKIALYRSSDALLRLSKQ